MADVLEKVIDYRGQSVPKSNDGIPLITARNIRKGFLDFSNQEYISTDDYYDWMTRGQPQPRDVLFTTEAPLGNVAFFPSFGNYALGQRSVALRPNPKTLDSGFLFHFLLSSIGQARIELKATGSTAKGIKSAELKKIIIDFPPLLEQVKIAAILSSWDDALENLGALLTAKRKLKRGLMQQLLTGRVRFKEFEARGEAWKVDKLGDITKMSSGGTPKSTNSLFYGGNIPWVAIADITKAGKYIAKTEKSITQEGLAESSAKVFPKGTVLFAMYASIGKCCISAIELTTNQAIVGIQPNEKLLNEYLYYFLLLNGVKYATMGQQGTQKNLNAGMVKEIEIPVPPLEEQRKIALVLATLDQEISTLEQERDALERQKRGLMQVLLTGKVRVNVTDSDDVTDTTLLEPQMPAIVPHEAPPVYVASRRR